MIKVRIPSKFILPEKSIQNQCLAVLDMFERQNKIFGCRTQVIRQKTIRKDGSQGYIKTGRAGIPDWTGLLFPKGQYLGIEFKTQIGRQTELQKETQKIIENLGGIYWIIRTPKELIDKINQYYDEN